MRRLSAWLVAVPLMIVGSQVAHVLAYRIAVSGRDGALARADDHRPRLHVVRASCARCDRRAAGRRPRRGRRRRLPPRPPAGRCPRGRSPCLPPLGYALQEITERWVAGSSDVWLAVQEPTFRIGLLLQLPFALVAFVVAWLLLRVARSVGQALAPRRLRVAAAGRSSLRAAERLDVHACAACSRRAGRREGRRFQRVDVAPNFVNTPGGFDAAATCRRARELRRGPDRGRRCFRARPRDEQRCHRDGARRPRRRADRRAAGDDRGREDRDEGEVHLGHVPVHVADLGFHRRGAATSARRASGHRSSSRRAGAYQLTFAGRVKVTKTRWRAFKIDYAFRADPPPAS